MRIWRGFLKSINLRGWVEVVVLRFGIKASNLKFVKSKFETLRIC